MIIATLGYMNHFHSYIYNQSDVRALFSSFAATIMERKNILDTTLESWNEVNSVCDLSQTEKPFSYKKSRVNRRKMEPTTKDIENCDNDLSETVLESSKSSWIANEPSMDTEAEEVPQLKKSKSYKKLSDKSCHDAKINRSKSAS